MSKMLFSVFFSCAALLGSTQLAGATVYYVDAVAGNDAGRYQIYDIPAGVSGAVVSDNLLWGDMGSADNSRVNAGADAKADPLFVNGANDEFHLQAASPAVDSGADAALPDDSFDQDGDGDTAEPFPFDHAGTPRISGGQVDIGAHEYAVGGTQDADAADAPWLSAVYQLLL